LLGVYSLGLGIPFIASAMFVDRITSKLRRAGRAGRLLQFTTGGVMVLAGAAMMTGQLTTFSYWLLETFPSLSTIG
jgi:cytochrome c-type biogenesis protein